MTIRGYIFDRKLLYYQNKNISSPNVVRTVITTFRPVQTIQVRYLKDPHMQNSMRKLKLKLTLVLILTDTGGAVLTLMLRYRSFFIHYKAIATICDSGLSPFRPRASTRVDASNQTNVKDRKHSHRARRRASTNLHKLNERCQFKLYIGYWTSNNNKWPKCSCQTPPDNTCANDVIDNELKMT